MLKLYRLSSLVHNIIKTQSVTAETVVPMSTEPNAIRLYDATHPNGILIEKYIGDPELAGPDNWWWDSEDSQAVFGSAQTGTIIAMDGDVFMFEGEKVPNSGTASERSFTTTLKVQNESTTLKAFNVVITPTEYYASADIEPSWLTLSLDNSTFSSTITIDEVETESYVEFYAKLTIPESTPVSIFRNVGLNFAYALEYQE